MFTSTVYLNSVHWTHGGVGIVAVVIRVEDQTIPKYIKSVSSTFKFLCCLSGHSLTVDWLAPVFLAAGLGVLCLKNTHTHPASRQLPPLRYSLFCCCCFHCDRTRSADSLSLSQCFSFVFTLTATVARFILNTGSAVRPRFFMTRISFFVITKRRLFFVFQFALIVVWIVCVPTLHIIFSMSTVLQFDRLTLFWPPLSVTIALSC